MSFPEDSKHYTRWPPSLETKQILNKWFIDITLQSDKIVLSMFLDLMATLQKESLE